MQENWTSKLNYCLLRYSSIKKCKQFLNSTNVTLHILRMIRNNLSSSLKLFSTFTPGNIITLFTVYQPRMSSVPKAFDYGALWEWLLLVTLQRLFIWLNPFSLGCATNCWKSSVITDNTEQISIATTQTSRQTAIRNDKNPNEDYEKLLSFLRFSIFQTIFVSYLYCQQKTLWILCLIFSC